MNRSALSLPLALLLILIALGSGVAQQLSETIGSGAQEVIREVSRYFADTPMLDSHLISVGFNANQQDANWRRMPAVRKIETAYLAAQTVSQEDADRVLARLAKSTMVANESARRSRVLADLSSQDTEGSVRFAALTAPLDPQVWSPTPPVRASILELSRYVDGGALGGTANLIQFYFELPDHEAYEILRTSNDSAEAIKRAMTHVPEAERNPKMTRIISDLAQSHPDIRRVAVFAPFLRNTNDNHVADSPGGDGVSNGRGTGPNGPRSGEGPSHGPVPPNGRNHGGGEGKTGGGAVNNSGHRDTVEIETVRQGMTRWVVTRNSSGKLFVHDHISGGTLVDLKYVIEESPDGSTWTVYVPRRGYGETQYGRRVGVIEKPESVRVSSCTCR